ncbi:MAG: type I-E CRISPR-associated protein Cse1/CasA [Ruminococcus sp.]|nr:type I-E CRISPR-associated protein Cse1/CasA [Ruminococcus sp.]
MNNTEFNLVDEPWIRVMGSDCRISEISLKNALVNAHEYKSLKGELPTQDTAVMRLLLAVLHTVISRYDESGNKNPLDDDEENALERWKSWWDSGKFPENAVSEYLDEWHERFWLFHPERPFFQVAGMKKGTDYDSPKLNGEVSESSNKIRLFSSYSGKEKSSLSYAQAARWLLYLNAYDDTSSKPTKEGKAKAGGNLPSAGAGWLGKLGLIWLSGKNLFETLMLNLVIINENKVQYRQKPVWEKEKVSDSERTEIPMPNNLAELYTLQSRRILLNRKDNEVVGYKLLGGDFFEKENAFFEPMTVWRVPKDNKKANEPITPKRHDSSKQMWREFSVIYNNEKDNNRRSGTVNWYCNYLYGECLISEEYMMTTAITSVEYGDKDFFVKNIFSDSLTMHSSLLSELGKGWREIIENEIKKCEELAYRTGKFAQEIYVSSGGSNSPKDKHYDKIKDEAKEQIYYRLDMPFREWLRNINPNCNGKEKQEIILKWQNTAKRTALAYADEIVGNQPETAVVGHKAGDTIYSAPKARNIYRSKIRKIYEGD